MMLTKSVIMWVAATPSFELWRYDTCSNSQLLPPFPQSLPPATLPCQMIGCAQIDIIMIHLWEFMDDGSGFMFYLIWYGGMCTGISTNPPPPISNKITTFVSSLATPPLPTITTLTKYICTTNSCQLHFQIQSQILSVRRVGDWQAVAHLKFICRLCVTCLH